MNGSIGRIRRVIAGLVSAMMVLTSLPLTGVAAYAAEPVADATVEAADTAADVAEDAVLTEDAAAAEDLVADSAADETIYTAADDAATDEEASGTVDEDPDEIPDELSVSGNVNLTFKATGNVTDITYGPTVGDENTVSMDDAKDGGATVSVNTAEHQKMIVTVSDDSLLLSDSVKIDDKVASATEASATEGKYTVSVDEADVTVDVTAYRKVLISDNMLRDKSGKGYLTNIAINGGIDIDGFTTGEAITFDFDYAADVTEFDVKLDAPEAWYMDGGTKKPITLTAPEGDSVTGSYSIKKEDVEKAIKAGSTIHIDAKGEETEKAKVSVTVPECVTWIEYGEYSPSKQDFVKENVKVETKDWKTTSENGISTRTGEIKLQKGNSFYLSNFNYYEGDNDNYFFRVMRGNKELTKGMGGYFVGDIGNGSAIRIEMTKLKLSDVKLVLVGNNATVSWNMSIDPNCLYTEDGVTYVKADYMTLAFTEVYNKAVNRLYVPGEIKYAVTGGSKGDVLYYAPDDKYGIYYGVMLEAAFAEGTGPKLTVTAKIVPGPEKPQRLMLVEDKIDHDSVKVTQSGAEYSYEDRYSLKYGDPVTVTMAPETGFTFDKVYLVKNSDIRAAGLDPEYSGNYEYETNLRAKVTAPENAIPSQAFTPAKDGTVKITIKKMVGDYTIIDTASKKNEVVVKPYTGDPIDPDKNGVYDVLWFLQNNVSVYNGDTKQSISKNSISATLDTKDVTSKIVASSWSTDDTIALYCMDDDLQGKVVTLEFNLDDAEATPFTLKFRIVKRPADDSISFAKGVLSGNDIIEPQPLGTAVTYDLKVTEDRPVKASVLDVSFGVDPSAVNADLLPVKNKSGKVTGYKLTIDSKAVKYLTTATIRLSYEDLTAWEKDVNVYFSTDQVKKTDLSVIKVTPHNDALSFDFSDVKIDRTTKNLYYEISVSACGVTPKYLKPGISGHLPKIPVADTEYTLKLMRSLVNQDENVEPSGIPYDVKIRLVQIDDPTVISSSDTDKMYDKKVTTLAGEDAIYATKINLKKVKSAGTLYGGARKGTTATVVGMDKTLIATVVYPNVGRKAVTEKQIKKLELLDALGNPVSSPRRFITEQNGNIYLQTKSSLAALNPGKYTVVAYAVQPKGKDVKATMKITLERPITALEVSAPSDTLFKKANKAASIAATVVYNYGSKGLKPKTKKVTWSVVDADGKPFTLPEGWSFRNGKVTIGKKAMIPATGVSFRIKAEPADFDHGDDGVEGMTDVITVWPASMAQKPNMLLIEGVEIKPGVVTSAELYGPIQILSEEWIEMKNVSIKATGALKKVANEKNDPEDPDWAIMPVKLGKGTIKVTATDGSGYSKTFKYTVKSGKGFYGMIVDQDDNTLVCIADGLGSTYNAINSDPTGQNQLIFELFGEDESIVDHSVKFTGLEKVKTNEYGPLPFGTYILKPTARNATIKIKLKNPNRTVTINVTNTAFPEGRKAAAKITASNKVVTALGKAAVEKKGVIYTGLNYKSKAEYEKVNCNKVTYTVKYGQTAAKADEKVRLYVIPKNWATSTTYLENVIKASGAVDNGDHTYTMTLGDGGTFDINYIDVSGKFAIDRGTYKIQVTPLDSDGKTAYNSGIITLKVVAVPKPSVKVSSKLSFTSTAAGASENLIPTKLANISSFEVGAIEDDDFDVRGVNVGGKINGFTKMFKVEGGMLVYNGVKDPSYNTKKGISGVVAVNYTALDGSLRQIYVPVTVKGNF